MITRQSAGRKFQAVAVAAILVASAFLLVSRGAGAATPSADAQNKTVVCGYQAFVNEAPDTQTKDRWLKHYQDTNFDTLALARALRGVSESSGAAHNFAGFVANAVYYCQNRAATAQEIKNWQQRRADGLSKERILNAIIVNSLPAKPAPKTEPKPPPKPKAPPKAVKCAKYNKGGSPRPLCEPGKAGTTRHVITQKIKGTNIRVNKAWVAKVTAFVEAGRRAGFKLGASDITGPGYGSFRTHAMQSYLYRNGFPAAQPGTSMHEWGLAIDLACFGRPFMDSRNAACRSWVRSHAQRFGIHNLPSEPWHWSSNGR